MKWGILHDQFYKYEEFARVNNSQKEDDKFKLVDLLENLQVFTKLLVTFFVKLNKKKLKRGTFY